MVDVLDPILEANGASIDLLGHGRVVPDIC